MRASLWVLPALAASGLATPAIAAEACSAPTPKHGQVFSGTVPYVATGDSLCIAQGTSPREWIQVELADFDAPPISQRSGRAAREALQLVTQGRWLTCTGERRSKVRTVATCKAGGVSVGDLMRQAGAREAPSSHASRRK